MQVTDLTSEHEWYRFQKYLKCQYEIHNPIKLKIKMINIHVRVEKCVVQNLLSSLRPAAVLQVTLSPSAKLQHLTPVQISNAINLKQDKNNRGDI